MALADLEAQEGWTVEGDAARVHYRGDGEQFSVEYYAPNGALLYWRVTEVGESAVPVPREGVPTPLRTRIREDLEAAGLDPDVERQPV